MSRSPVPIAPAADSDARDEDLKTRVAWLYYMEGNTQDAVAERLQISRLRVLRLLAAARQDGTVQIQVTSRLSHCAQLECQLERTFDIGQAIVVPAPRDGERLAALIGAAAGAYLSDRLHPGITVGLGWGETLRCSLIHMPQRPIRDLTVVSLLGGLTRATGVNPSEFAWRFAAALGAECYMVAAPVYAPDEATRTGLLSHPGIAEVFAHARRVDLALVGVGDISPESTIARFGLLDPEELGSLRRLGAVGDVLCRFIDRDGQVLDHPINRRVLAADPAVLRGIPNLVLASGGWRKVAALLAAIRLLNPNVLVTDEHAARGLLASQP